MGKFPTVSDVELPLELQLSRRIERDGVLDDLTLQPGDKVVDLQSAAGFLADEIYERWGGQCPVYCVEPSAAHRARISSHHHVVADELTGIKSLPSGQFRAVVGLAGLHHSESHRQTLTEALRLLSPGGSLSICDVEKGTKEATWLEEVVGSYCRSGSHDGRYPQEGEILQQLEQLGYVQVKEKRRTVPWVFADRRELVEFLTGFFDLDISDDKLIRLVESHLAPELHESQVNIPWTLLYWTATKPL